MAKLTRKQKIAMQQTKKGTNNKKKENYINPISLKTIFKKNAWFMLLLVALCFGIYFNSLDNELTLVDDIQGFVHSDTIKDLSATLKGHSIQSIVYSLSYQFFKYNPMPLRIVSVSLHALITLEVFILIYLLFNKKQQLFHH